MDATKEGRVPGTGSSPLTQLCGAHKASLSTADTLSAVSPSGTRHQESSLFSQETISLPSTVADCHVSLSQSHQLLSLQLVLNQLQRLTKDNICQQALIRNSPAQPPNSFLSRFKAFSRVYDTETNVPIASVIHPEQLALHPLPIVFVNTI